MQYEVITTASGMVVVSGVGPQGANGTNGVGIPVGGTVGQVLSKIDSTDYNTQWSNASGGGGTWGTITGTLSSQTDLQTALNSKQNSITLGSTAQYFRGDLSLATFPTLVSSFTNDASYITNASGLFVNNTTNGTLTRSGVGPYTLGINLSNANTWTAKQTLELTTEQFRIGYNVTNALKFTMASANQLTLTPLVNSVTSFNYTNAAGTSIFNIDSTNQRVGIGTSSPNAKLDALSSSITQFRFGYDPANYCNCACNNSGLITFDAFGTSHAFLFNDPVSINGKLSTDTIAIYSGTTTIDVASRVLIDSASFSSLSWSLRQLNDEAGASCVTWGDVGGYALDVTGSANISGNLFAYGGIFGTDLVLSGYIYDNSLFYAADIPNRRLYAIDGSSIMLDWSNTGGNGTLFNPSGTYNGRLGSSTEAFYATDALMTVYILNGSSCFVWEVPGFWGGNLGGSGGAAYFHDSTNSIYLCDNTRAVTVNGAATISQSLLVGEVSPYNGGVTFETYGLGGFVNNTGAIGAYFASNTYCGYLFDGISTLYLCDGTYAINATGNAAISGFATVADDAYSPTWDGNFEVPTKNAVYDKIQTISGGSATITEVEVDFGTTPTWGKTFTVTDATVTATSKIMPTQSGSVATSRVGDDAEWDAITYAAKAALGTFTLTANVNPGPIVGKRKVFYQVAA